MAEITPEAKALITKIETEHRDRGRTLSELANRLIVERKRTMSASQFEQWIKDIDIVKRCAEHTGACQGITEVQAALLAPPA